MSVEVITDLLKTLTLKQMREGNTLAQTQLKAMRAEKREKEAGRVKCWGNSPNALFKTQKEYYAHLRMARQAVSICAVSI